MFLFFLSSFLVCRLLGPPLLFRTTRFRWQAMWHFESFSLSLLTQKSKRQDRAAVSTNSPVRTTKANCHFLSWTFRCHFFAVVILSCDLFSPFLPNLFLSHLWRRRRDTSYVKHVDKTTKDVKSVQLDRAQNLTRSQIGIFRLREAVFRPSLDIKIVNPKKRRKRKTQQRYLSSCASQSKVSDYFFFDFETHLHHVPRTENVAYPSGTVVSNRLSTCVTEWHLKICTSWQ